MSDTLHQIAEPLLGWFAENKRALPWREDREPYHVWISEIMLQQTRIEAVMRYYARFTAALPDVRALSRVSDDGLLKLWEGLGYYSRARNLKKAANTVMTAYGGDFPKTYRELLKLEGVGEYTAGAIASICFNERVPAVDGNVLRVTARITGDRSNVLLPETKKAVTARLREVMPAEAGDFNEALMELGETVCLPNAAPLCEECPLKELCTARREHLTEVLPVRIKTARRRREEKTVFLIVSDRGRLAIEKRGGQGLLTGMYQLPNIEGYYSEEELKAVLTTWSLAPKEIVPFREAKHVFTHIDWLMKCFRVQVAEESGRFLWVSREELQTDYPLPTAFKKLL